MIYLSGKYADHSAIGSLRTYNGWSRINIPGVWAADNGCFNQPEKYSDTGYLRWLSRLNTKNCLFAVAPDVVGDAIATRKRAYPMLPRIRELGFKAAYVCQDGETPDQILWDELDAIFIGGSTKWKLSQAAADIAKIAKQKNKWVHMGRVNSYKQMSLAAAIGCDSVDGTFIAFAPDKNKSELLGWLRDLQREPLLSFVQ